MKKRYDVGILEVALAIVVVLPLGCDGWGGHNSGHAGAGSSGSNPW